MHRLHASLGLISAVLLGSVSVSADDTTMPPHVAARLGLVEAWQRTIPTPYGSESIADQQLFVHEENPHVYVEIVAGAAVAKDAAKDKLAKDKAAEDSGAGDMSANNKSAKDKSAKDAAKTDADADSAKPVDSAKVLMRIAVDVPDDAGVPVGMKEAERLASNEIRRLKRRGVEASMRTTSVRRVILYTIADDGTLEARDAETGRPIWMTHVGRRGLPFGELGVSEKYLTVINGANMIQVDAETGDVLEELRTNGAPQFGAVNVGDYALVVTVGGGVEGFSLADPTGERFREIVDGRALAPPTRSPSSSRTGWATDRGFVYVMELLGTPSTMFRLGTDGLVRGRLASAEGDRFFFASDAGQVYGLRATRSGEVMWVTPFGEPFYTQPLVLDDQVFVLSTYGDLFALSTEDGSVQWDEPASNIDIAIGGFGNHLFGRTKGGSFTAIDRKTGKTFATFAEMRPRRLLSNTKTNRLYVVGDVGVVQCMRPIDSELPVFTRNPDVKPVEVQEDEKKEEPGDSASPFEPGGTDPFGAGSDPFGAGAGDPFGAAAGSDPFGGGGADPFGGNTSDDPFGN